MFATLFASIGSILGWSAVLVLLVVVLLLIFNRKALGNFFSAANAQVSKLGRAAAKADPVAVYQQEIDNATEEIRTATGQLEGCRGLVSSLTRQVGEAEHEVKRLEGRIENALEDADDQSITAEKRDAASDKAGEYAMQLQTAQGNLATLQGQLKTAQKTYDDNLKKIQLARTKIQRAEQESRQLGMQLQMSETNAQMSKLAQNFNVNVNGLDSKLADAKGEIQRQIDTNNAVSEVQKDLGTDGMKDAEEEERQRKRDAQKLLAKFKEAKVAKDAAKA